MKMFIEIMMLLILSTILFWHAYTNKDVIQYAKKNTLFKIIIVSEFVMMLSVYIVSLIVNK